MQTPLFFCLILNFIQSYEKRSVIIRRFFEAIQNRRRAKFVFGSIAKKRLEATLKGELDAHLGYEKHEKALKTNARNGFSAKKVKTSYGESQVRVPRDREASFNPMIIPKRQSMVDGIENVIVSLYAKGMSLSDIEEQIREVYNFDVSTSTISHALQNR